MILASRVNAADCIQTDIQTNILTEKLIRVYQKKKIWFSTLLTTQHIDGNTDNNVRKKKKILETFFSTNQQKYRRQY